MRRTPAAEAIPEEIARVRERFEQWRKERSQGGPLPEELWEAACALTEHYPVIQVARHLRLNHTVLKSRAKRAMEEQALPLERKNHLPGTAQFVQLPPVSLFSGADAAAVVIELRGADGATLTSER